MKCYSSVNHTRSIEYFFEQIDNNIENKKLYHKLCVTSLENHISLRFYFNGDIVQIDFDKNLTLKNMNKINYVNKKLCKYKGLGLQLEIYKSNTTIINKIFDKIKIYPLIISWVKSNIDWNLVIPKNIVCDQCWIYHQIDTSDELRHVLTVLLNMNYWIITFGYDNYSFQTLIINVINEFEHDHFYFKTNIEHSSYMLEWKRK